MSDTVPLQLLSLGRPRTRADCRDGLRPCPWVRCRHHLAVDVSQVGVLSVNAIVGADDRLPSCSLDVAEASWQQQLSWSALLRTTSKALGVSRSRAGHLTTQAVKALRRCV